MHLCRKCLFLPPDSPHGAESANATVQEAEILVALCSQISQQV